MYSQRTDEFAARNFKRLIKLLERCNENFSCDVDGGDIWDEREIENLKLGVAFREKEFKRGDSVRTILVPHALVHVKQFQHTETDDNG